MSGGRTEELTTTTPVASPTPAKAALAASLNRIHTQRARLVKEIGAIENQISGLDQAIAILEGASK